VPSELSPSRRLFPAFESTFQIPQKRELPFLSPPKPVLYYRWNFGDGTNGNGATVTHTYTRPGDFTVLLLANGLDPVPLEKSSFLRITAPSHLPSYFAPRASCSW